MTGVATGSFGRIAILGGGAIGQLYAHQLAQVALDRVTLVTRREPARDAVRARLQVRRPNGSATHLTGLDVRLPQDMEDGVFDVVLVAVSAYDTAAIAPLASRILRAGGVCLTMQNGINNQAALQQGLGGKAVALGATSFVVHLESSGDVSLDGAGVSWLPALPPEFDWLAQWFSAAGLNPTQVDDPLELLWRKAAIATNGYVSLALASPIGRVVRTASGRESARVASLEVAAVARAAGIGLRDDDIVKTLRAAWASCSESARSSLYSDYLAGRHTEIDERLGAILERAAELQVAVPTLQALYLMCKARLELGETAA